jgi:hypothetical protein
MTTHAPRPERVYHTYCTQLFKRSGPTSEHPLNLRASGLPNTLNCVILTPGTRASSPNIECPTFTPMNRTGIICLLLQNRIHWISVCESAFWVVNLRSYSTYHERADCGLKDCGLLHSLHKVHRHFSFPLGQYHPAWGKTE